MNRSSTVKLILTAPLVFSMGVVNAQVSTTVHNTPKAGTGVASKSAATKPPVTKKLSFAQDTFSQNRKSLDVRAQSLSEQDLAAQKKAATEGAPDSMYLVGAYSLRVGDEAGAKQWWSQAAQRDDLFAMVALAELPSVDGAEKRKWLESAAAKGVPPAEMHLGEILLVSQGGPEEFAEGKKLILKSAADGCVDAQILVGASYLGLSSKYPGLFENNPVLGQQYLQAAKMAHSQEARNILRLAVEKGIVPDPFKTAPQLDSGDTFVAFMRRLDPEDRVLYLRQQIAKHPQSARLTQALEEIVWLSSNHTDEPEFKALQTQDPTNVTAQTILLSSELDRMYGHPQAKPSEADVKTATDVINRWKAATGFDRLAQQHSYLLTHEIITVAGEEKPHQINCATDLKNVREEEPDDFAITAVKGGRFQYYRPRDNGENLRFAQAASQYDNSTTYLTMCLNLPASVQTPDLYQFAGIKTFWGASAYALFRNSDNTEDYFDTKSFFYLGSQQTQGAWTRNAFGYHDFGGAVLPQYMLFHFNNNIRLIKFTGLQWDRPPALDGDIYTLTLTPYPQYPQSKWVPPVLADAISQNEIALQPIRIQQQLDKLTAAGNVQFGLDPVAQKDRLALLTSMQAQAAALSKNSQQWDQVASGIFETVVQHDRQRRFKNPADARDVYLNWKDVTNLDSLLAHRSLRVNLKNSMSGSHSTMSYCAMTDGKNLRRESANTLVLQNNEHSVTFNFDVKRGVSRPTTQPSTPSGLRQDFMGSCLLGVADASALESVLPTSALGTGTIYKRPAYVIFEKYNANDSTDDATRFFFDKETYVLLGTQAGKDESPDAFSDFRKVGDSILSFREYQYSGGQYPSDTIDTIEKLDFDVALNADEFDLNPATPQILHASTLKEKRPELYKTASPWAALATGTLLGVAQGAANDPTLFGSVQQAQLTSLQATILAKQIGGDFTNFAAPSFTGLSSNQSAMQLKGTLAPGGVAAFSAPLMTPAQLQVLENLILSNSTDGKGSDSFSESILNTLKQMAGERNLIQQTADQQTAAMMAIGNANTATRQQAAQQTNQFNTGLGANSSGAASTGAGSGASGETGPAQCTDMSNWVSGTTKVDTNGYVSGFLTNHSNQYLDVIWTFARGGQPDWTQSAGDTLQPGQTRGGQVNGYWGPISGSGAVDSNPPKIFWRAVLESENQKHTYGCVQLQSK